MFNDLDKSRKTNEVPKKKGRAGYIKKMSSLYWQEIYSLLPYGPHDSNVTAFQG